MMARAGKTLRAFVDWWLGELGAMVPAGLRNTLSPLPVDLCMVPESDRLSFFLRDDNRLSRVTEIELDDDVGTVTKILNEILSGGVPVKRTVTILLPGNQVLRPQVELPVDAAGNLEEVLAFEMDRHTPFTADEVDFDFRVLGTDPDLERLTVEMLVARKIDVARAVDFADRLDLGVRRVTALDIPWAQGDYNLLEQPKNKFSPAEWRQAATTAATVLLVAALIYLPLDRKARTLAALESEVAGLRQGAGEATKFVQRAKQLSETSIFIVDAKHQKPTIIGLLDDVTRRMPDGSWLTNLTVRRAEVAMTGYSSDPSAILRGLEESALLQDAKFSAPVTRDVRLETDRFRLTVKISPAGAP